jgi:hypothetical protein
VLNSTLASFLVQLVLGSDDATTIVNSVLSAYGEWSVTCKRSTRRMALACRTL